MDERPIRSDEYEPDWTKISFIGCAAAVFVTALLILLPIIILLWKAALR